MLRRTTLAGGILAATALTGGAIAASPSVSAAEAPTNAASTSAKSDAKMSFPCGFSFWKQSYKNCSDNNILVVAPAHESASNKWFEFQHCLKPGEHQMPLADAPGMLVYKATHVKTKGSC